MTCCGTAALATESGLRYCVPGAMDRTPPSAEMRLTLSSRNWRTGFAVTMLQSNRGKDHGDDPRRQDGPECRTGAPRQRTGRHAVCAAYIAGARGDRRRGALRDILPLT